MLYCCNGYPSLRDLQNQQLHRHEKLAQFLHTWPFMEIELHCTCILPQLFGPMLPKSQWEFVKEARELFTLSVSPYIWRNAEHWKRGRSNVSFLINCLLDISATLGKWVKESMGIFHCSFDPDCCWISENWCTGGWTSGIPEDGIEMNVA